jgi:hypothetical protein
VTRRIEVAPAKDADPTGYQWLKARLNSSTLVIGVVLFERAEKQDVVGRYEMFWWMSVFRHLPLDQPIGESVFWSGRLIPRAAQASGTAATTINAVLSSSDFQPVIDSPEHRRGGPFARWLHRRGNGRRLGHGRFTNRAVPAFVELRRVGRSG